MTVFFQLAALLLFIAACFFHHDGDLLQALWFLGVSITVELLAIAGFVILRLDEIKRAVQR